MTDFEAEIDVEYVPGVEAPLRELPRAVVVEAATSGNVCVVWRGVPDLDWVISHLGEWMKRHPGVIKRIAIEEGNYERFAADLARAERAEAAAAVGPT